MREELLSIGIACLLVGIFVPLIGGLVHGVNYSLGIFPYVIPLSLLGIAIIFASRRVSHPKSDPAGN
jgi:hypothetical protein